MVDAALVSVEQTNTGNVYFKEFSDRLVSYGKSNAVPVIAFN